MMAMGNPTTIEVKATQAKHSLFMQLLDEVLVVLVATELLTISEANSESTGRQCWTVDGGGAISGPMETGVHIEIELRVVDGIIIRSLCWYSCDMVGIEWPQT